MTSAFFPGRCGRPGATAGRAPVWLFLLLGVVTHGAQGAVHAGTLHGAYAKFRQEYGQLAPRIPLSLHSVQVGSRIRTEVFGTVDGPYGEVARALSRAEGYCDFLPPLFNLKACVHFRADGKELLRFYVGGKRYTSTIGTIRIRSGLRELERRKDYLHVQLATVNGDRYRYGYTVDIEIVPSGRQTLARVETDFNPDRFTRLGVAAYLHTFAGDKIGFTSAPGKDGKMAFVHGMTGIIERNTVRSFLAMQAYLDTLNVPEERRYDARLQRWFDLTDRFPRQLHEMSRADYLSVKQRERVEQMRLQRKLDERAPPSGGTGG